MTNDQAPMTNAASEMPLIGHWDFAHWSLVPSACSLSSRPAAPYTEMTEHLSFAGVGAPTRLQQSRRNMAINVRSGKAAGTLRVPTTLLLLVGLLVGLVTLPGCSGCNWGGKSTQAKAKKDGKKENELE